MPKKEVTIVFGKRTDAGSFYEQLQASGHNPFDELTPDEFSSKDDERFYEIRLKMETKRVATVLELIEGFFAASRQRDVFVARIALAYAT